MSQEKNNHHQLTIFEIEKRGEEIAKRVASPQFMGWYYEKQEDYETYLQFKHGANYVPRKKR